MCVCVGERRHRAMEIARVRTPIIFLFAILCAASLLSVILLLPAIGGHRRGKKATVESDDDVWRRLYYELPPCNDSAPETAAPPTVVATAAVEIVHNGTCNLVALPWRDTAIRRAVSEVQYWKTLNLVKLLDMILTAERIPYFMFGSALYGSYMCHDMLPWDCRVSFIVRHDMRRRFEDALLPFSPEFIIASADNNDVGMTFQSGASLLRAADDDERASAYIGVNFYKQNASHVWEYAARGRALRSYSVHTVLPLHRRPFGPLALPAPRDTRDFIQRSIAHARFNCERAEWRARDANHSVAVSCGEVGQHYGWVHRRREPGGWGLVETLMVADRVSHRCVVDEPSSAVTTKPFDLQTCDEWRAANPERTSRDCSRD